MRIAPRLVGLTAIVFLAGNCCVMPETVVLRPDLEVTVAGDDGKPVSGATVTVFRWSQPFEHLDGQESVTTDAAGHASFAKEEEVEAMYPLCMHSVTERHMTACVSAPGLKTEIFGFEPSEAKRSEVVLHTGSDRACDWSVVEMRMGWRPDPSNAALSAAVPRSASAPSSSASSSSAPTPSAPAP